MLPTCGERSGDEGAGDDDEPPESPAEIDVARCGSKPYLGGVTVINTTPKGICSCGCMEQLVVHVVVDAVDDMYLGRGASGLLPS